MYEIGGTVTKHSHKCNVLVFVCCVLGTQDAQGTVGDFNPVAKDVMSGEGAAGYVEKCSRSVGDIWLEVAPSVLEDLVGLVLLPYGTTQPLVCVSTQLCARISYRSDTIHLIKALPVGQALPICASWDVTMFA